MPGGSVSVIAAQSPSHFLLSWLASSSIYPSSTAASPCDDATGGYLLPFALATIADVLAALTLIAGRREGRKLA